MRMLKRTVKEKRKSRLLTDNCCIYIVATRFALWLQLWLLLNSTIVATAVATIVATMELSKQLQKELDQHVPKREQQAFAELAVRKELAKLKAMKAETIEVFVDGGSRGNPGPAGGGFAA